MIESLNDASLTQTNIYFTHYLFEAYYHLNQPEAFFNRMGLWFDLPAQGFRTTFEGVVIEPMPGHLTHLAGEMIHPKGTIKADLRFEDDCVRGQITLPAGVSSVFRCAGKTQGLNSGSQEINI